MGILEVVFLLGAALVAVVGAVPTTLMEDTKQAQLHASGKVKRAQEVMLFGNQQNRPSEAAYFQGLKRDEAGEEAGDGSATTILPADGFQDAEEDSSRQDEGGKSPAQYEKGYRYGVGKEALDKHVENALLKSELFGEPSSVNQYRYYGGGERRGLQESAFAPPSKRSGVSSFRPMVPRALPSTPRLKRDLELDPEDVLALLSLWEAEHHKQFPYSRSEQSAWSQFNGVEPPEDFDTPEEGEQQENEEDNPNAGGWWEGPVYPSAPSTYPGHFSLDKRLPVYYPAPGAQFPLFPQAQKREGQWGGFAKDKRFMVSRKRQVPPRDGVHSLAQLLNSTPRRDPRVPVLRRMVL